MLNDNIRKYRKLNNMSQDELAEKLEVTRQSISLWETGQTQPSLENVVALANLFNISTDELLTDGKTEPAVSSAAATSEHDPSKKTTKVFFLILCFICVIALVIVVLSWSSRSDGSENHNDTDKAVDTTANLQTATTTDAVSETISANAEIVDTDDVQTTTADTENVDTGDVQTTTADTETETVPKDTENVSVDNTPTTTADIVSDVIVEDTEKDIFGYLKNFVIQNGTVNGDYCYYSRSADTYGGYASEDFSLYYWGDTDKIEFCLHSVIDDTFSINFYLYVPREHDGSYVYISSYYYRDTGIPLYEAKGTIDAEEFTDNYPLNCTKYIGSTSEQNVFMEISRQGICDLIRCLKEFIEIEDIAYSFADFGFLSFED